MHVRQLRKHPARLLVLVLLSLVTVGAVRAAPLLRQSSEVTLTVSAGYDGQYKRGNWMPVYITITNNGNPIAGTLQIVTGNATLETDVRYDSPVSLPTQSNKRVITYIFLPDLTDTITVTLLDEQERVIAAARSNRLQSLEQDTLLYAVITPQPDELGFLETVTGARTEAAIAIISLENLPEEPAAWGALDVLILNDVDTGPLSPAQQDALRSWLDTGGQLVVTGGPGWQQTTAAVADLLPVTITDTRAVTDLPALSAATQHAFRDPGPYIVTFSSLKSGELLYHQDNLPLLARQQRGRGSIYFLALDPQLAPLVDWDGSPVLWNAVANNVPVLPYWGQGPRNAYAAVNAVESLPSLVLPSVAQLILFLILYVLMIGPINYAVLKRWQRLELAWVTIPALILIFSGIAYVTGFRIKGNDTIINQMSVAFGQANSDSMRVHTLIGLYSPRRRTYDLTMPASALVRPFDNRGMDMGSGGNSSINRAQNVIARDLLVDVSGVQTLVAASYAKMPAITGSVDVDIAGETAQFVAELQNNSDINLESTSILFGGTVYAVGDLAAGDSKRVSFTLQQPQPNQSVPSPVTRGPSYASTTSPLNENYDVLLGSANYYDDRRLFPRAQLLDSLAPDASRLQPLAPNAATLIGWSSAAQLETSVNQPNFEQLSTTLYFIELPVATQIALEQEMTTPRAMWSWQVLGDSGVYNPTPDDLFLVSGWVEFQFQPWLMFQALRPEKMELLLSQPVDQSGLPAPELRLWDWAEETWVLLPDVQWGKTPVVDFVPYVGENNTVRIRLRYDNPDGVRINGVYPTLTGQVPPP